MLNVRKKMSNFQMVGISWIISILPHPIPQIRKKEEIGNVLN